MFNAPFSAARAESLMHALGLTANSGVLDLGCGNGALLHLMAASAPIHGAGVDMRAADCRRESGASVFE